MEHCRRVGTQEFQGTNGFILTLGLLCGLFDLLYIWLLVQARSWGAPEPRA